MARAVQDATVLAFDALGRVQARITIAAAKGGFAAVPLIQELEPGDPEFGNEERVQLLEGCSYDYELESSRGDLRLNSPLARRSKFSAYAKERGALETRSYVGVLSLAVETADQQLIAVAHVEVRSAKLGYRSDYRTMLSDVSRIATELVIQLRSPSAGRLVPKPAKDLDSISRQFMFLESLVWSRDFADSVARITAAPHRGVITELRSQRVGKTFRLGADAMRQLAFRQPRLQVNARHPLNRKLRTVPTSVEVALRGDTLDTAENRFVKHVLVTFEEFLDDIERVVSRSARAQEALLKRRIAFIRTQFSETLSHNIFRSVGALQHLPAGSAVLQRRAGYKEVLNAWVNFHLAAALDWRGGADVYGGGKKDVATLYEYWTFLTLLRELQKQTYFEYLRAADLVKLTNDGLGLILKSGEQLDILGRCNWDRRVLSVRLSYNRSFAGTAPSRGLDESGQKTKESWTRTMQPDLTLSFWPTELGEEAARSNNRIVHIHFDSKYRMSGPAELVIAGKDQGPETFREQSGVRSEDLVKMHAYLDAIRGSRAALVLYPGTETAVWRRPPEEKMLLGAFPMRPGDTRCVAALCTFIFALLPGIVSELGVS